jgi:hypothetical protein
MSPEVNRAEIIRRMNLQELSGKENLLQLIAEK